MWKHLALELPNPQDTGALLPEKASLSSTAERRFDYNPRGSLVRSDVEPSSISSRVSNRLGFLSFTKYRRDMWGTYILLISSAAAMPTSNSPSVGSRSACLASCIAES